jgi:hypothetical protein
MVSDRNVEINGRGPYELTNQLTPWSRALLENLTNIVRRMRWVGHVARMGEGRDV